MSTYTYDFDFTAGDYQSIPFILTGDDNNPFDLQDRTIKFFMKGSKVDYQRNTLVTESTGEYILLLDTDFTKELQGQYEYAIIFSFPNDPDTWQFRVKGHIEIFKSITNNQ